MRMTYDPEANAAYIQLRSQRGRVTTIAVTPELNIDVAADGEVCGIELLNADKQLSVRTAKKLVVENQQSGKKAELRLPLQSSKMRRRT